VDEGQNALASALAATHVTAAVSDERFHLARPCADGDVVQPETRFVAVVRRPIRRLSS